MMSIIYGDFLGQAVVDARKTGFEEADARLLAATGEAPPYELAALAPEHPPERKSAADGLKAASTVGSSPASEMLLRKPLLEATRDGDECREASVPAADGGPPT
jgi:hypothetical protein